MVPVQVLSLKQYVGDNGEYSEADTLLYHLELHEVKRSAIALKTKAVGWHLTTILKKGDAPRKGYHPDERPLR